MKKRISKTSKQYFQSWKEEAALLKQKLANDPTFRFSKDKSQQQQNKDKDKDNNGDTNGGDNDNDNDIIIEKIIQLRGSSIFPQKQEPKIKTI